MKIRLRFALPVGGEHGMTKGRVLEVLEKNYADSSVWVLGNVGEKVKVLKYEFDILDESPEREEI